MGDGMGQDTINKIQANAEALAKIIGELRGMGGGSGLLDRIENELAELRGDIKTAHHATDEKVEKIIEKLAAMNTQIAMLQRDIKGVGNISREARDKIIEQHRGEKNRSESMKDRLWNAILPVLFIALGVIIMLGIRVWLGAG